MPSNNSNRDKNTDNAAEWEAWILFMLKGVEVTAEDTISLVKNIGRLMAEYKIDHVVANMQVSRQTTSKYLDRIVDLGLLKKEKMGKENYYINTRLMNLSIEFGKYKATEPAEVIESVHVNEIVK